MAEETTPSFNRIEFDEEDVQGYYDRHGSAAEEKLAKTTALLINEQPGYEGKAIYEEILTGYAPILTELGLSPDQVGKGLTPNQILRAFSTLKSSGDTLDDGSTVPTDVDAFLGGLTRGTTMMASGYSGAKFLSSITPPVLPFVGPFAKPVAGVIGYVGGTLLGDYFVGKPAQDNIFGSLETLKAKGIVLTPQSERYFRSWESGGTVIPFAMMPWTLPNAQFGIAKFVKELPSKNMIGPISKQDMANPLIKKFLEGKDLSRTAKAFVMAENALVSGGQSFSKLGKFGKGMTLGLEATAGPATYGLVSQTEKSYPRSAGARFGAEFVGSLAPQITILKHLPKIVSGPVNYTKKIIENYKTGKGLDLLGQKGKAQRRAIQEFLTVIEDHKEDPKVLLQKLEEVFLDPKTGGMKKDFMEPNGKGGFKLVPNLFTSAFLDSIAITRLENTVIAKSSNTGLEEGRKGAFSRNLDLLKSSIYALKATGDPELLLIANSMQKDRVALLINKRIGDAVTSVVNSVNKIYPEGGEIASKLLGEKISTVMDNQRRLFRDLEKSAWDSVDKKSTISTFYRGNADEGDEVVETGIPNFIEEWDALIDGLGATQIDQLKQNTNMRILNNFVLESKIKLGLDATDPLSEVPSEVLKFYKTYDNSMGTSIRSSFDRVIEETFPGLSLKEIPATSDNIKILGALEEKFRSKGRGANVSLQLEKAQKDLNNITNELQILGTNNTKDQFTKARTAVSSEVTEIEALQAVKSDLITTMRRDKPVKGFSKEQTANFRKMFNRDQQQYRDTIKYVDNLIKQNNVNTNIVGLQEQAANPVVQGSAGLSKLFKEKRESLIARIKADADPKGDLLDGPEPLLIKDLIGARSTATAIARETGTTDDNIARVSSSMAEAILTDLNGANNKSVAYNDARSISYAFNEYLKRTFAGDILTTNGRGKQVVNPHLLKTKILSGSPDAVGLRLDQISKVGEVFKAQAKKMGFPTVSEEGIDIMLNETQDLVHHVLQSSIRDITASVANKVNLSPEAIAKAQDQALRDFRLKNKELFNTFPHIGKMFDEVENAGDFLRRAESTTTRIKEKMKSMKAFSELGNVESPSGAINTAFNSKNPTNELNNLITMINKTPNPEKMAEFYIKKGLKVPSFLNKEKALEGLKQSILDFAFTKSGSTGTQFNSASLYKTLFERMPNARGSGTTLAKFMVDNKVMSKAEMSSMQSGLKRIIGIEAQGAASGIPLNVDSTPTLFDLQTRILGARLGSQAESMLGKLVPIGETSAGSKLVGASFGSRYAQYISKEIPAMQEFDALQEILTNPELMSLALRTPRSPEEKMSITRLIVQGLKKAGIGLLGPPSQRAVPLGVKEFEPLGRIDSFEMLNQEDANQQSSVQPGKAKGTPTARLSSNEPFLSGLNTAPAGGGISSATPANPNQRSQYASLFPNDIISGMIQPTATMAEGGAVPPREVDIKGQPHMLAYITPKEGGILQLMGGSGRPGPMGIPSFYGPGGPGDDGTDPGSPDANDDDTATSGEQNNTNSNTGEFSGSGRHGVTNVSFSTGPKAGQTVSIYGRNSQKQKDSRRDAENIRDAMMNNNNPNVNKMNLFTVNKNPVTMGLQKTSIYGPKGPNVDTIQSLIDSINVQNARDARDAAQQPQSLMDSLMSGINIGNVNVSPGRVGTGYGVNFGTTFAKGGPVGIASLRRR
jgi:hypothetical protein